MGLSKIGQKTRKVELSITSGQIILPVRRSKCIGTFWAGCERFQLAEKGQSPDASDRFDALVHSRCPESVASLLREQGCRDLRLHMSDH